MHVGRPMSQTTSDLPVTQKFSGRTRQDLENTSAELEAGGGYLVLPVPFTGAVASTF